MELFWIILMVLSAFGGLIKIIETLIKVIKWIPDAIYQMKFERDWNKRFKDEA